MDIMFACKNAARRDDWASLKCKQPIYQIDLPLFQFWKWVKTWEIHWKCSNTIYSGESKYSCTYDGDLPLAPTRESAKFHSNIKFQMIINSRSNCINLCCYLIWGRITLFWCCIGSFWMNIMNRNSNANSDSYEWISIYIYPIFFIQFFNLSLRMQWLNLTFQIRIIVVTRHTIEVIICKLVYWVAEWIPYVIINRKYPGSDPGDASLFLAFFKFNRAWSAWRHCKVPQVPIGLSKYSTGYASPWVA